MRESGSLKLYWSWALGPRVGGLSGCPPFLVICQACGITCYTHLAIGKKTAAEDVLAYASEESVDEIVVGIKKRSQLGKMIFGSTARMIIMQATCPVLTVK